MSDTLTPELREAAIAGLEAMIQRYREMLSALKDAGAGNGNGGGPRRKMGRPSKVAKHIEGQWDQKQGGNGNGRTVPVQILGITGAMLAALKLFGPLSKVETIKILRDSGDKHAQTSLSSAFSRLGVQGWATKRKGAGRGGPWQLTTEGEQKATHNQRPIAR